MTKEDGRISRTIECKVGKTQISSITLDTGHEKKILGEIKKRDNYLSKSKVVEWALDDFFTAHGFEIVTDRREREGQADVLLPTSIKLSKHKGEDIKSGETKIFPIRVEIIHNYFLEYIQEIMEEHVSKSKIYEWALDSYFEK